MPDQPLSILPRCAGGDGGEDAVEVALVAEACLQKNKKCFNDFAILSTPKKKLFYN
jgi:hypothetical protein